MLIYCLWNNNKKLMTSSVSSFHSSLLAGLENKVLVQKNSTGIPWATNQARVQTALYFCHLLTCCSLNIYRILFLLSILLQTPESVVTCWGLNSETLSHLQYMSGVAIPTTLQQGISYTAWPFLIHLQKVARETWEGSSTNVCVLIGRSRYNNKKIIWEEWMAEK